MALFGGKQAPPFGGKLKKKKKLKEGSADEERAESPRKEAAEKKAGYTPVIWGWGIKTAGKFQSNAATDLTDTLPDGYAQSAMEGMPLIVGVDSLKINITAGTGFIIYSYYKTPTQP